MGTLHSVESFGAAYAFIFAAIRANFRCSYHVT